MLREVVNNALGFLPFVLPFIFVLHILSTWATLRHVPGPFFAAFTNLPRLLWVRTRRAHEIHIALHSHYGPLVPMGPNMVSVGNLAEIKHIYGFSGSFKKSDLYGVFRPYSRGKVLTGMVALQDEEYHRMLRGPFASIYSANSLLPAEPLVDSSVEVLMERLGSVVGDETVDFGFWIQLYVFDVLCQIAFSRRLGFLDRGEGVGDMLELVWKQFHEGAPISQMPWTDFIWRKNPILLRLFPAYRMTPIVPLAMSEIKAREQNIEKDSTVVNRDILSSFIKARTEDPSIPEWALLTWTLGGIGAGGDTSVNVIRALFYNLLKHPQTMHRLKAEIDSASQEGRPSWKTARLLPYFGAFVKEAARIHPSIGLPLERVVPPGGSKICGKLLRGGTIVGINAWVVNRDPEIFGQDSDTWRPERWLCSESSRKKMEQALFSFGAGHRVCPGQNLFDLIASKLVLAVMQTFEIELALPDTPLKVENSWLVKQTGFIVRLKKKTN